MIYSFALVLTAAWILLLANMALRAVRISSTIVPAGWLKEPNVFLEAKSFDHRIVFLIVFNQYCSQLHPLNVHSLVKFKKEYCNGNQRSEKGYTSHHDACSFCQDKTQHVCMISYINLLSSFLRQQNTETVEIFQNVCCTIN